MPSFCTAWWSPVRRTPRLARCSPAVGRRSITSMASAIAMRGSMAGAASMCTAGACTNTSNGSWTLRPPRRPRSPSPLPRRPGDTSAAVVASTALPEAPASVNCHILLEGRQIQLTLRDTDETRLLQRLAAVLQQYPLPAPPATQDRPQGQGWCSTHNVQMKLNHGQDGRSWYSHRTDDGRWCKGR